MSRKQSPALVLIDLQHDYLNSKGLEPHRGHVTTQAALLLETARSKGVPVIHVWTTVNEVKDDRMPHWKASGKWSCVAGTDGHTVPPSLRPLEGEPIVNKTFFSAFSSNQLDRVLRTLGTTDLVLTGVHLHACVRATALDAYQLGYRVWISDGSTGSDDPVHAAITRRYLDLRGLRFVSFQSTIALLSEPGSTHLSHCKRDLLLNSPSNPSRTWKIPVSDRVEITDCIERARKARSQLCSMSAADRMAAVLRVADGLEQNIDSLARTVTAEIGKPIKHAKQELGGACRLLHGIVSQAERDLQAASNHRSRRRPLGNVALISPWNNPVSIPLGKIAPALLYGNSVVWKPAEAGTTAAERIHRLISQGFSEDVVTLVTGSRQTGTELISASGIDAVTLTGSLNTGRAVQEVCARRMIPLQAELGGNNAAIVLDDCDVSAAAKEISRGAFAQAGQRCTANRRAVVLRPVLSEFLGAVKDACAELIWGDPFDESVDIGPLISRHQKARVEQALARARADGCAVKILDPKRAFDETVPEHCYLPPTIVQCEDAACEVVQEELFSPTLVVQPADSFEHAIALSNDVKQGLAASIFTSSQHHVSRFLEEVEAGILKVNQATDGADPEVPFGGWKASGIGPAEHGASDREFYSRVQAVYL